MPGGYDRSNSLTSVLRCGRKRLRLTMDLNHDDEWEEWMTEDLARKAGLCIRAFWMHDMYTKRNTDGEFVRVCLPYRNYPHKFFKYFRMTVGTFDYILANIEPRIRKHSNRPSISPAARLAVTLR